MEEDRKMYLQVIVVEGKKTLSDNICLLQDLINSRHFCPGSNCAHHEVKEVAEAQCTHPGSAQPEQGQFMRFT